MLHCAGVVVGLAALSVEAWVIFPTPTKATNSCIPMQKGVCLSPDSTVLRVGEILRMFQMSD
ncbi:exported hypothetical protein [Candidatus Nitrospira nitrosa]|uniref:Uncharacterized protein n=1 Tax=Candidatus Nitrospira nitrosa TaxID=1742972 RepID=A0A0S4LPG1_9BACT|nr:exported hypothetical protein [Candidatus Nitrospira nitrosa]